MKVSTKSLKKPIAWLLMLCMVLSLLPSISFPALAASASASSEAELLSAYGGAADGSTIEITLTGIIGIENMIHFNRNVTVILKTSSSARITPSNGTWNTYDVGNHSLLYISGGGSVTIGSGITFDANFQCRNITVGEPGAGDTSNTLVLDGCTITQGTTARSTGGGGLYVGVGNQVTINGNTQFLNNRCETTSGTAGGAIYVSGQGTTVTINSATFSGNAANSGGAIYVYAGTVICSSNVTFSQGGNRNTASQRGGAIHCHGNVVLNGTTISGQESGQFGGAVYVSYNSGAGSAMGRLLLNGAKITGNSAGSNGGGIYIANNAEVYVQGATQVADNTCNGYADNAFASSTDSRLLVSSLLASEAKIGVSTSNPYKEKVLAKSLAAKTDVGKDFGGVELSQYSMAKSDTEKFKYDSEVWLLEPSSASYTELWLTYNLTVIIGDGGSTSANHVAFDFNLPGKTPLIYENRPLGESIPIPVQSTSSVGTQAVKFLGWFEAPSGGTALAGTTVNVKAGLTVYYAQWEPLDSGSGGGIVPEGALFPVFFDRNYDGGGLTSLIIGTFKFTVYKSSGTIDEEGGSVTYAPEDYTFSMAFVFPGNPQRVGYEFKGWGITPGATSGVGSGYVPTGPITFYAIWQAKTYTITWDANSGTGSGTTTQAHDSKLQIPAAAPTRTGYTFTGWFADQYGGTPVSADTIVTSPATYYAGWAPKEYTITWDAGYTGGSVAATQQRHDEPLVITPDPVRNGYAFAGWWTSPGGQGTNAQSYGLVRGHQIFYAYWVTDTMSYTVTLDWNDFGDNDAVRPDSVQITLLRSGLSARQAYTFYASSHSGDVWSHTFLNLPVADAVSNPYVYSVAITSSIPDDYTYASDFTTSAYAGYIRLTHALITWDVPVYVVWEDDSDRDGYRPATVDVQLCAGGVPIADTEARVALSGAGNTWTYTFPSCQKYFSQGTEILYSIEVTEPDRYVATYSALTGLTATLAHAVDTVSKTVMVEWQDNNNQDSKRPASMTVQLHADNQPVQGNFITLSAANGWSYTWVGLPKLRDGGTPIVYSVYVSSTLVDYAAATTEMMIEMTYTPSQTAISAFISWTDEADADGLRPDFVIAELIADGVPTGDAQQLSAVNNWRAVWTGYPIYHEGSRIEYTFCVTVPEGYTAEYLGVYDTSGLSAILSHTRIRDDFMAQIVWNDGDNRSGARMALVRVMLYADGSPIDGSVVSVTETTGWQHTYNGYPVYRDGGIPIRYSIGLDSGIGHYAASFDGMALTLSLTPETLDVPLSILWDDGNNAAGIRPVYVAVTLRIGGIPSSFTAAATAQNDWSVRFEGLAKYREGGVGERMLYEPIVTVPPGYTVAYIGQTAVLTANAATADYYAAVTWQDNDNQYGQRPAKATLTLFADYGDGAGAIPTGMTRIVTATDGWVCIFEGLTTTAAGTPIVYSVNISGDVTNYTPTYDGMDVYMRHNAIGSGGTGGDGYTIDYTARLVWADNYNALFSRPFVVTLQLFADGAVVRTAVLTEDNLTGAYTWSHLWAGLPAYNSGVKINYTIGLAATPHGYTVDVQGESIILTHVRDITVSVAWQDNNDQSGKRPSALSLSLLADGMPNGQTVSQSGAGNVWTYTFANQPVWSPTNGSRELIYTWVMPGADAAALTVNAYTIDYHAYEVNTVTIWREVDYDDYTAEILWDDDTDRDGLRPDSVTAVLCADGTSTGKNLAITGDADAMRWAGVFTDLPVYSQGQRIIYTIEVAIPDGYTAAASASTPQITLQHVPARVDVTAALIWDDTSSDGGLGRVPVTVELTMDGTPSGELAVLDTGNGWSHTWPGRFAYHDRGTAYHYAYVLRSDLPGDYGTVTGEDGGTTILRAYFSVSGTVVDAVGHAVSGATVTLYNSENAALMSTATDNAGAWQFPGVRKGAYTVRATHITTASLAGVASVAVNTSDVQGVVLALDGRAGGDEEQYTYTVSGLVLDRKGEPVTGALVQIWSADHTLLGTVTADSAGGYQFTGISNGAYQISVVFTHDGYSYTASGAVTVHHANVQVPAFTVTGNAGTETHLGKLEGVVKDKSGKPIGGAEVYVYDETGRLVGYQVTGADGTYSFTLPVGKYTVSISYPFTHEENHGISVNDDAAENGTGIPNVDVTADSYTISGYVQEENGNPIEGAHVYLYRQDGEGAGQLVGQTVSDAGGHYEITGLPAGRYIVKVIPRYGIEENYDVDAKPNAPDDGDGPAVTTDSYTVSGTVLDNDGSPVKGATVILTDLDGNAVGQQVTGEDGKYAFPGLDEGAYLIIVSHPDKEDLGGGEVDVPGGGNPGGNAGGSSGGGGGGSTGGGSSGGGGSSDGGGGGSALLHSPYVHGYVDGTFRPLNAITRSEAAAILSRVSAVFDPHGAYAVSFPDVPSEAWYTSNLGYCVRADIFTGFPDGSFGPEVPITRTEFAAIVARLLGLDNSGISEFEDVTGTWAEGYIAQLTQKGIVTGLPDGTFAPTASISRAEAVTILNRALNREPVPAVLDKLAEHGALFSDVDKFYWAYYQVLEAATEHLH